MAGRDEINVMATQFLKPDHQSCQALGIAGGARAVPTDVVVLAEYTAEIAPGEENRSRAIPTAKARFLAVMRKGAGDPGVSTNAAKRTPRLIA